MLFKGLVMATIGSGRSGGTLDVGWYGPVMRIQLYRKYARAPAEAFILTCV